MTQPLVRTSPPAPAHPARRARARRLLRGVAVLSCAPYLCLKVAWIAGSRIGIPEGSSLLEHRGTVAAMNAVTVLMDAAVIVLALLLTRPWGRRVPAWLLAVPVWVATGLLAPIMAGFPIQLLVDVLGGASTGSGPDEPFLEAWVFGVVYTGFIVQGLSLGALFVIYARDRWGGLWHGLVWELPVGLVGGAQRLAACAATLVAVPPFALHLLWACGGTSWLSAGIADDDASSGFRVVEATSTGFLAVAVAGGALLAFRRGPVLPVAVPLALAWVGSAATACWGGWMTLSSLTGVADVADRPTPVMHLVYSAQMIVGILVASVCAYFLAERSALPAKRPA
ncbi:hypothetical protein SUDANB105_05773 [Streptomyces sp. enrichment culture]|uniref:hypothetical protein n=1 Tax=Streptomyces sp. enrichment culture TaxID=1795815 RepID=UPI003F562E4C